MINLHQRARLPSALDEGKVLSAALRAEELAAFEPLAPVQPELSILDGIQNGAEVSASQSDCN